MADTDKLSNPSNYEPPSSDSGKAEDAGVFNIHDTQNLLKYVWTACLLATDRDGYSRRLGIDMSIIPEDIWKKIDPMLGHFGKMKAEATVFREKTYEGMIDLVSLIIEYADNAGGQVEDSYYANILTWIMDYGKEKRNPSPNQDKMAELKESILDLVTESLQSARNLQTQAADTKQKLHDFVGNLQKHAQELKDDRSALEGALDGPNGDIQALVKEIQQDQKEYDADEQAKNEAEKNQKIAFECMAIPIFGTIAGGIAAGVFGAQIHEQLENMRKLDKKMQEERTKLKADQDLIFDLKLMDTTTENIGNLIAPAVTTLQKMEGAWRGIADDLQAIVDAIGKEESNLAEKISTSMLERIKLQKICTKWDELKAEGKSFRANAYIGTPEMLTIKEFIQKMEKEGKI